MDRVGVRPGQGAEIGIHTLHSLALDDPLAVHLGCKVTVGQDES